MVACIRTEFNGKENGVDEAAKMPTRAKANQGDAQGLIARALAASAIDASRNYSGQLFGILRRAIARSQLPPGTLLSEAAIAEAAGLSRTPVREALRQLSVERLVDVYPQAGTVVSPIRLSLLREACFVRGALEAANFAELAPAIDAEGLSSLRAIVASQREAMEKADLGSFMDLDDALHAQAFKLMGRERVWTLIDDGKVHLDRVRFLLLERLSIHAGRVLRDHESLCGLLEARDAEKLALAARTHVEKATLDLLELREAVPAAYFAD
jgi:DNA-binding GntR family transcriptional regulator